MIMTNHTDLLVPSSFRYISPDSWHRQEAEVAWGRHDMQEGQQEEYVDYVIKSVTLGKLLETGTHLQFHVQTPAKGGGKMGAYASQVKCED